jgi:hypothetical protein
VLGVASAKDIADRCAEQKKIARAAGGASAAADVIESLIG